MSKFKIRGGRPLSGTIKVQGAKNALLPIMASVLARPGKVEIKRAPSLRDTVIMKDLFDFLGGKAELKGESLMLDSTNLVSAQLPEDQVRKMRASFLFLGSLLARFGEARVPLPGGCAIGARPVQWHLMGLEKLGTKFTVEGGVVIGFVPKAVGAEIDLPFPSVGATQNILSLAMVAEGETVINGVACEPEVQNICRFLQESGVKIEGVGTSCLRVEGNPDLKYPESYTLMADRVVMMTYGVAPLIAGGHVRLEGCQQGIIDGPLDLLSDIGADVVWEDDTTLVVTKAQTCKGFEFVTQPYPGMPTDIQSILMALALFCKTPSQITETIFSNRFMHTMEMIRMGANIVVHDKEATIKPAPIRGADVVCADLRGGAGLVLAALGAEGEVTVNEVEHIDRGYVAMEKDLQGCGVDIERVG